MCKEKFWKVPSAQKKTCSRQCAAVLRMKPRITPKRKECRRCHKTKAASAFYNDKNRHDGLYPYCKGCQAEIQAERLPQRQAYLRQWNYGVTPEQFEETLKRQGGKCAICKTELKSVHTDHCHTSKEFRGILCSDCNRGLGCFKDNPEHLKAAARYILKPPAVPRVRKKLVRISQQQ